jgi:hypothetical protein
MLATKTSVAALFVLGLRTRLARRALDEPLADG